MESTGTEAELCNAQTDSDRAGGGGSGRILRLAVSKATTTGHWHWQWQESGGGSALVRVLQARVHAPPPHSQWHSQHCDSHCQSQILCMHPSESVPTNAPAPSTFHTIIPTANRSPLPHPRPRFPPISGSHRRFSSRLSWSSPQLPPSRVTLDGRSW